MIQVNTTQARRGPGVAGGQFTAVVRAESEVALMERPAACRLCPACQDARDRGMDNLDPETAERCSVDTGGVCALSPSLCGCEGCR